jgi:hypothetical protein
MFDHHCPFINNCLGMNNFKWFLIFIFSYFIFLVLITGEIIRNELDQINDNKKMTWVTFLLYLLITFSLPIVTYQVYS